MFRKYLEGDEAILQVRAAGLYDDRLAGHLKTRPRHPFVRRSKPPILLEKTSKC